LAPEVIVHLGSFLIGGSLLSIVQLGVLEQWRWSCEQRAKEAECKRGLLDAYNLLMWFFE